MLLQFFHVLKYNKKVYLVTIGHVKTEYYNVDGNDSIILLILNQRYQQPYYEQVFFIAHTQLPPPLLILHS